MITTAVDTSVVIAALLSWHESHAASLGALKRAIGAGHALVLPAPVLVEAYSVMTRLPSPHRLAPDRALDLLSGSFEKRASVVALDGGETWTLLRSLAGDEVAGGRAYDGAILACARKGRAHRLLTLDAHDFSRLDARGIDIVAP